MVTSPGPADGSAGVAANTANRQQRRSNLSTRRLLTACAHLIIERGYEKTTLAEIGKRAGYSRALVTTKFGSKANLFVALVERMSQQFGGGHLFDLVGERVGIDALQEIIREIARDARQSPQDLKAFYALLFEGLKPIEEIQQPMREMVATFRTQLARLVERGVQAGEVLSGTDPEFLANFVHDAIRGASYRWLLNPQDIDYAEWLDSLAVHLGKTYRIRPSTLPQTPSVASR